MCLYIQYFRHLMILKKKCTGLSIQFLCIITGVVWKSKRLLAIYTTYFLEIVSYGLKLFGNQKLIFVSISHHSWFLCIITCFLVKNPIAFWTSKNAMRLSVGFSKSQAIDDYYSGSWVAISSLVEAIHRDQRCSMVI